MSQLERDAKLVVEALQPGWLLRQHDCGGRQAADFAVTSRENGTDLGFVEVTTVRLQDRQQFRAEVNGRDWNLPTLTRSWWVKPKTFGDIPSVDALHEKLAAELERVSSDAPAHFSITLNPWDPDLPSWHRELHLLGIESITPVESMGDTHRVEVRDPATAGGLSWQHVLDAVHRHVSESGNLRKLRKSSGEVAELFIWLVDGLSPMTIALDAAGLLRGGAAVDVRRLPDGISRVWVAVHGLGPEIPAVAVYRSDGTCWVRMHPGTTEGADLSTSGN